MTPTQARILTALFDGGLCRSDLRLKSGISSSTSGGIIAAFVMRGWVLDEPVHDSPKRMISITPAGKKALKRYEAGEPDEVLGARAESRTVVGTVKEWQQPKAYFRNEGNKHIGSHGYGC